MFDYHVDDRSVNILMFAREVRRCVRITRSTCITCVVGGMTLASSNTSTSRINKMVEVQ